MNIIKFKTLFDNSEHVITSGVVVAAELAPLWMVVVVVEEEPLFFVVHLEEEGALSALHLQYIKICRAISNNFGVIPLLN